MSQPVGPGGGFDTQPVPGGPGQPVYGPGGEQLVPGGEQLVPGGVIYGPPVPGGGQPVPGGGIDTQPGPGGGQPVPEKKDNQINSITMIRDQVPTPYPVVLFPLFPKTRQPIFSNNSLVFYQPNTTNTGAAGTVTTSRIKSRRC